MAETVQITFKVSPAIAARLDADVRAGGPDSGLSRNLVAKGIVLRSLTASEQKPSDQAIVGALLEVRNEVQQLSDQIASQNQAPQNNPVSGRQAKEIGRLADLILDLKRDLAATTKNPIQLPPGHDFNGVAQTLGRQARTLEVLEAKLETLSEFVQKSDVVLHLTDFAKKTHENQVRQNEQTCNAFAQAETDSSQIHHSLDQLRDDLRQTLMLLLGYVEGISQAKAESILLRLLSPPETQPCYPSEQQLRSPITSRK